jgi:hypothetical protein
LDCLVQSTSVGAAQAPWPLAVVADPRFRSGHAPKPVAPFNKKLAYAVYRVLTIIADFGCSEKIPKRPHCPGHCPGRDFSFAWLLRMKRSPGAEAPGLLASEHWLNENQPHWVSTNTPCECCTVAAANRKKARRPKPTLFCVRWLHLRPRGVGAGGQAVVGFIACRGRKDA